MQRRGAPGKEALASEPGPAQAWPAARSGPASLQPPGTVVQARPQQPASLPAQLLAAAVRPDILPGEPARALPPGDSGRALPAAVQARMEHAFGADFSAVRIHEGSQAAAIGAQAFTRGADIHFAPGRYDPHSRRGQELIGHELTHVVQQSHGRVHATAQASAMPVNDDPSLEREADQMGAMAARGDTVQGPATGAVATPASSAPAQSKPASPVVQMKSDVPLMKQADPLIAWAMRHVGDALAGYDPDFKSLFKRINDYDRSTDGRPSQQLAALDAMLTDANRWYTAHQATLGNADLGRFVQLRAILLTERATVLEQHERIERFTANANSPYEQMTAEGMVWSHADYEHGTKALKKTGKAYFDELSAMNLWSMQMEAGDPKAKGPASEKWFGELVERAASALSHAVVNHYTTSARAKLMLDQGSMKSKMKLQRESPTFKHNTSAYDDYGLANSGFVFFFIESPDARMRATRFADGDDGAKPARISIPIRDSGLLEDGWVMLSDFAQREYPDIMTNKSRDEHTSWLPTRAADEMRKPGKAEFTETVRQFTPGLAPLDEQGIESIMKIKDPQRRQAASAVTPQVRGDAKSIQTYTGPRRKLEVPDRMFNNVLVGRDIIPGLATRAALEVARIAFVNPVLAEQFKKLDGEALMLFMLKDLFRPQAMVPNSVPIRAEYVQS